MQKNQSRSSVFKDVGDQAEWIIRAQRVGNGDTAINKVHKMQKVASEISRGFNPSAAAPSGHNNFSRDFKPVNFLPRNHRFCSYTLTTRYPLVRIAHAVRFCFVFAPRKTEWRRAVSSGRARTWSRERLSFHTDYNKAASERNEGNPREE